MAGRRVSLASLASSKVETVPGASRPDLIHVHPGTVAPTPLNPRRAFDEAELAELGEDMRGGQLQPCVAVNKAAYLKLYPEHAELLPEDCRYVMAAGERRWRAAVKVGLDTLDLMLRHDLTESRVRFLAAVLSENVQRANFNPIEEADGLRAMLDLHDGNQAAAARAMGKSKGWFNQRIGLLRLTDEMVQLVFEGKLTALRDMRRYAAMPPEQQYTAWKTDQEKPPSSPRAQPPVEAVPGSQAYTAVYVSGDPAETHAKQAEATRQSPDRQSGPADYHGVIIPDPGAPEQVIAESAAAIVPDQTPAPSRASGTAARQPPATAAVHNATASPADSIPEPRDATPPPAASPSEAVPKLFPYRDGREAAHHLIRKMPDAEFDVMLEVLLEHKSKHRDTAAR